MKQERSPTFLERAEKAAEWHVREWIRKTLHEVFLRGFQHQLVLSAVGVEEDRSSNNNQEITTVQLQAQGLENCLELVRRVSEAWQHELRECKHFRTAQWVHEVCDSGRNNLWTVPLPSEGWMTSSNIATKANHQHVDTSHESSQRVETIMMDQNRRNDDDQHLPPPYSELRKLGRVTSSAMAPQNTDFLSQLKYMGEQGQSYWPLDHEIIDEMAETIPKRQRWERRIPEKESKYQVVVSKNVRSNEDDEDEQDAEDNVSSVETSSESDKIFAAVLRKSSNKIKSAKLPSKRRRLRPSPVLRSIDEIPRPPSNVSSSTHDVHEELTAAEKEELDRTMIHPEDDATEINDESSFRMGSIFGALQDVGMIHARIQEEKKAAEGKLAILSESQRRRQERVYIKERLVPRRIQKNQDPQKYRSKILRTEQECEDGTIKTFLELDLGWSLMEYWTEGEKRLMVFSSMQITLEELDSDAKRLTASSTI